MKRLKAPFRRTATILASLMMLLISILPMPSLAESFSARFTGSEAVRLGKKSSNIGAVIMKSDGSLSTSIARHWVTVDGVKYTAFCIEASKSSTSGQDGRLEQRTDAGLLWILTHVPDDTDEAYAIKQQAVWRIWDSPFPSVTWLLVKTAPSLRKSCANN